MKDGVATMPTAARLPESGRLLGIVCDALRLTLPPNRKANGRRYLAGERALPDEARVAVVRALVEDALQLGYLGDVPSATTGKERDRWIELVTSGVVILMRRWDHAVGHLAAAPIPHLERAALVTACLRAAVVDVALRAAAFRMLAQLPLLSPATQTVTFTDAPPWSRPGGAAAGLARRVKQRGVTRDSLYDNNTLDDWMAGRRRPSPERLAKLAAKLEGDEPVGAWRFHFLWDFALAYLADAVRSLVGDDVVDELAAALRRITCLCIYPLGNLPPDHRDGVLTELARWGALTPVAHGLLEWLQQQEGLSGRVEWARAASLGDRPWSFLGMVAVLPPTVEPPRDISLPDEVLDRMEAWIENPARDAHGLFQTCASHPALLMWLMRTLILRAMTSGQVAMAAPLVAQLADAVGGTTLHFEAAAFLAGAGRHDEAAHHLAQIPADDPLRGPADALMALTHLMTGQHREALETLETIEDGGGALLRARGQALLGVGQASAALEVLERVIAAEPRDAVALELAAQCCTALGRTRDATRYSKAADRLGRPDALKARARGRRARRA